jgi:chromosomal replication initiator protein
MNISQIISIVSKETGVPITSIVNSSRKQETVLARHLSMWACRWNSGASLQKIAAAHSRNQHGSVIHAANSIEDQMSYDKNIKEICTRIINQIKQ